MSDKVILTPPYPGNQRGAIWAEGRSVRFSGEELFLTDSHNSVARSEWVAELEFRATGPERGGGNLNIWYAKNGPILGTSSIYTVGHFDGLVIVIDPYGGKVTTLWLQCGSPLANGAEGRGDSRIHER